MKLRARLLPVAVSFCVSVAVSLATWAPVVTPLACTPSNHQPVAAHGRLMGAGPSIGVHASDHIDVIGDSITLGTGWTEGGYPWFAAPGGVADQLAARFNPPARLYLATATGGRAIATGGMATTALVTPLPSVTITSLGGAGLTAVAVNGEDFLDPMMARIPAYITSPIIIIELAINDAAAIGNSTETIGQFNTAYTSIAGQIMGHWPSARLGCMYALADGEHWSAGPTWGPGNLYDPQVIQVNGSISTICTAAGGVPIDQRTTLLNREVTQNTGNLLSGVETVDGVHPKIDAMAVPMPQAFFAAIPPS